MEVLVKDDEELSLAHKEYEKFTQDEELRELYWMRVEGERLIMTQKEEAYQEGLEEGIEK